MLMGKIISLTNTIHSGVTCPATTLKTNFGNKKVIMKARKQNEETNNTPIEVKMSVRR